MPDWVTPMAATLTEKRFKDPGWTFERKLDGIRVLAYKNRGKVELWSRNRLPLTANYPAAVEAIAKLPVDTVILDGEAAWAWGRLGRADYHVFDVLFLDGQDLRELPLRERRVHLRRLKLKLPLAMVPELDGDAPWEHACTEGWEGVVAKRLDSPYESRRSPHWLKMKCEATQELVVGGFTDPQGARVGLGALLVGYYDQHDFVFAGKVGTGLDTKLLTSLRTRLNAITIEKPPFTEGTGLPKRGIHWVKPEIVVQVAFTEWTPDNKMRHPRLLGLRPDKAARDLIRETTPA